MRKPATMIVILIAIFTSFLFAEEKSPSLRLPDNAKPTKYDVQLSLDPDKDNFSGTITIDLQVEKQTQVLWLNATDIQVQKVELNGKTEGSVLPAENEGFIGVKFSQALDPGMAKLKIDYTGEISNKDSSGIFKMKDGDTWYVYTQFEPDDARRAFPCFDEPLYKVPWQMEIRVPKNLIALTNTPQESEKVEGDTKIVKFAKSHPLPSYLISFAVGSFDFAGNIKIGKNRFPFRVVTPKGRTDEARWVVESTPPIVDLLEEYFGIPYPYEKLDQVAIPKVGYAMEHPGLITYGEDGFLVKPENETLEFKKGYAAVGAHELAHQWFGDLVTMKWWDDLWLNESFASWMGAKIVDKYKPEWKIQLEEIQGRKYIMNDDSLVSSRKIREPIRTRDDILNAFDSITYGKGEAILQMFESWIGEEKFRTGVQQYLHKYAWGNATAEDFLKSVGGASNPDLTSAFATFLNQSGVPLISTKLGCASAPTLDLQMSRSTPLGSKASSNQLWQVPVCAKYDAKGNKNNGCQLMKNKEEKVKLNDQVCPDWYFANRDGWGYYHVMYPQDQLKKILNDGGQQLSVAERITLINDLDALMHMGKIPAAEGVRSILLLLKQKERHVINTSSELLEDLDQPLVTSEIRDKYGLFIRNVFGPTAQQLGWEPKPNEDDDTKLLRQDLMLFIAEKGQDSQIAAQATDLAKRWFTDHKSVQPDLVSSVLCSGAIHGDENLLNLYHEKAKQSQVAEERTQILDAMACFENRDVASKALNLVLSNDFDIRESINIAWKMIDHPATNELVYDFVTKNYDTLAARLPRYYEAELSRAGTVFCDNQQEKEVDSFFRPRVSKVPGGPRILDQTLEEIHLCSAFRSAQQASFKQFLQSSETR